MFQLRVSFSGGVYSAVFAGLFSFLSPIVFVVHLCTAIDNPYSSEITHILLPIPLQIFMYELDKLARLVFQMSKIPCCQATKY